MNSEIIVLLLNFFIGFISDLGLNFLSRQAYAPIAIKALEIYFKRKTIKTEPARTIISAINAGLTVIICLMVIMLISKFLFGFFFPMNIEQLYPYLPLTFLLGYFADVLIYKLQLFGNTLNPYYKVSGGAGLWGALSIIFSVVLSYGLLYEMRI